MTCIAVRSALSALLDGEACDADPIGLDEHLGGCPGCREWRVRAERVTRAVRVQAVEVPDLTPGVLAAVAADTPATATVVHQRRQVLRYAVGLVAVVQVVLAAQPISGWLGLGWFGPPDGLRAVDGAHASREMASFELALAVGFVLAAYRPRRARAFVPVALVLAGCLAVTIVFDIANANTLPRHEVGHLAALVQAALLWALARAWRGDQASLPGIGAAGPAAQA